VEKVTSKLRHADKSTPGRFDELRLNLKLLLRLASCFSMCTLPCYATRRSSRSAYADTLVTQVQAPYAMLKH
jgi:hypothetical protein